MTLASVTSGERGATDRLLARVVARVVDDGVRVLGALRPIAAGDGNSHCNSDLWLLPEGPVVRITQDLGAGSTACRMDAGALEEAVGMVAARMAAEGADLVVLNKFGLSESEGRGFRPLIAEAQARGIPVLLGLPGAHRVAFEQFADGMATALPPDEAAILDWLRAMVRAGSDETEGI